MAEVKHRTPADGTFSGAGAAAWDDSHTLSDVASQTSLDALSQAVSAADAALSARVDSVAGLAGGGSVTSNELSAAAAALSGRSDSLANAVSVVSQAVSVLSNAMSVADAALSARGDSIATAVNTVSQNLSVLSQAVSVADAALSSRGDSLATGINAVSQAHSALSQANSAAHVSLQTQINTVSQAVSVLSQAVSVADAALSSRGDSLANAISAVSQAHSVLSQANSAAHVSLQTQINTVSQAVSVLSQAVSVADAALSARSDSLANAVSVVSNAVSTLSNANSASHASLATADANLSLRANSLADAISNIISAGGGGVSVTSQELSAKAASVESVLSDRIDSVYTFAGAVYVLGRGNINYATTSQGISATTLTNVNSLFVSVDAGGIYELNAQVLYNRSGVSAVSKLGMSFPAMVQARGFIEQAVSTTQTAIAVSVMGRKTHWSGDSASNSVLISDALSQTDLSTLARYTGTFYVSATGTVQIKMGVSAAAQHITVCPGSWIRVYQINQV